MQVCVKRCGSRKDTLAWRRLRCHMRRRLRLAGLRRPRAASTDRTVPKSLQLCRFDFESPLAMAPTECAADPCDVFRLSSPSTPKLKWNVRICSRKSTLPSHACVPPKNQRCLSRISMRVRTPALTQCRYVCHGSAPFVGCGARLGKRLMPDAGFGVGSPRHPASP